MRLASAASPERVAIALIVVLVLVVAVIMLASAGDDTDRRSSPGVSPSTPAAVMFGARWYHRPAT